MGLMLAGSCLAIAVSGNLTNRWTVIFPMVPLVLLQCLRLVSSRKWISALIFGMSILLILSSAALSILFPAVELPPIVSSAGNELFNVGVVDLYLPIDLQFSTPIPNTEICCPKEQDHATVRILYPTLEPAQSIPYLRPHTSEAYCEENMKHSAPLPLRPYSWMLHNWRLIEMRGRHHAQPCNATTKNNDNNDGSGGGSEGWPIVFFSHGLGGSAEMYSYQTQALAKNGYVVVVIDHSDGSAPVVSRKDGTLLRRNETSIIQYWMDGRKDEYRLLRKAMVAYRAQELLAVVDNVLKLNENNLPDLQSVGIDFRGLLNTNDIHYMGHSFGGATSLHAATQRPPRSVIAHDPVMDWMPQSSQSSFFDLNRLKESKTNHTYWTSKSHHDASDTNSPTGLSLHDTTELLVLFSHEWYTKGWSGIDVMKDMADRKVFGRESGVSRFGIIDQAHHNEFSDASMLTPLWLAREVGLTGPRNPLDTAQEIHFETLHFLRAVSHEIPH
jgi:pimeloyl-ACP methyl ester carboxylesterase